MRRERKLVTVVFCDLVGFTARSEALDPEDVESILRPYHERLRSELERHGGTVEKFIGDAVMAVFGAPQAHEDDPERAVRAAFAIRDWVAGEEDFEVRIAVNTGEALVSLDARPEVGEGMVAGDVVNTAARMQSAAPINGVLVGEQTYRATSGAVDYRHAEPVQAKGKSDPIPVWEAVQARAGLGVDVRQLARAKLVGREGELRALREAMERVHGERQPQAVTLLGAPGLGKSRLVYELFRTVEEAPELVYWRQGRCLPYGEGVTFWALAEVVKAQAGILETDSAGEADGKLRHAVSEVIGEDGDADWVLTHLRPLAGLADAGATGEERQAESFFAWRRFLEAIASGRPFVLVFEDLHWADERFLDFVEHLIEWAAEVPMFILCTSRPELLARRPGWAGTISLSPLSNEETAALVHALLERAVLPAEVQTTLLERAGGNPLYAEEFARMVGERGPDAELPLPETVQGVIAARIDGLSQEDKELLQDGAVVGKIFWPGAVAAIAGTDRWTLEERLQGLARRDFLRRERRSSVEGESEYAFLHVLVRDVAYASIPRAGRAERHRLAAEWLESLSEDRTEDRAELLAHHYGEALELARAAGASEEAERLEGPARRYLIMAGDRAFRLDVRRAEAYFRRVLEALPPGDLERAKVLAKLADAAQEAGRLREAVEGFEEAIPALRAAGADSAAGEAMTRLARARWRLGETARSGAVLTEAVELLERLPPSAELARAYAQTAVNAAVGGRSHEALEWVGKALPLVEEFELDDQIVRMHQMRGIARCDLGDWKGLDDLREALRLGLERALGFATASSYLNLGEHLALAEGPAAGLEYLRLSIEFAAQRGLGHHEWWSKAGSLWILFELGRWDELLQLADEVIAWDDALGGSYLGVGARADKARVLVCRGETDEAAALVEQFLPPARSIGDYQLLAPALETAARVAEKQGDCVRAVGLIEELLAAGKARYSSELDAVRVSAVCGALELGERWLAQATTQGSGRERSGVAAGRAALAEARGELESAADLYDHALRGWSELGCTSERAFALLGLGRVTLCLGRAGEAAASLTEARAVLTELGARPLLAETDALLAEATAAAS